MTMYQHGWGAASFTKTAAEIQLREYAVQKEFRSCAKAPRKVLQSQAYHETVSDSFFEKVLLLVLSTIEG